MVTVHKTRGQWAAEICDVKVNARSCCFCIVSNEAPGLRSAPAHFRKVCR